MSANSFALLADEGFTPAKKAVVKKDTKAATGTAAPKKDAAPKDRHTKGGRSKGVVAPADGAKPAKRQFDRHVSGTGRYRGEKKQGNTKGGSGDKLVITEAPAEVVEEVKVEEPAVPAVEEPKAFLLADYEKSKAVVAGDKKAARVAVAAATGANISTKATEKDVAIIVTKPGAKKIDVAKKSFNLDEFQSIGSAAPEAQVAVRRNKVISKRAQNKADLPSF